MLAAHIDAYFSAERLIERLVGDESQRPFRPDVPFYSVDMFDHTVPFYLGRTVTLVHEQGELAWGIANAPAQLRRATSRSSSGDGVGDAEAIRDHDGLRLTTTLRDTDLPMRLVDRDGRRVIVSRN